MAELALDQSLLEEITAYCQSQLPNEACGLLARRFIPIRNILHSESAYEMDPGQLVTALRDLRNSGDALKAIVHSHPRGPAEPSERDIRQAYYPEAAHLIVSLADVDHPQIRVFRIAGHAAAEIELHVIV